jgi:hypothetical protein
MPNVTVADHVKATAPKVWELIGRFEGIHKWAPGIKSAATQGTGSGAMRTVTLAGGEVLVEKQISRTDDPPAYTYSIENGGLGLTSHISTLMVVDHGDGSCTVSWVCNFEAKDKAQTESIGAGMRDFYKSGIAAIKKRFEPSLLSGLTAAAQRAPAPPQPIRKK